MLWREGIYIYLKLFLIGFHDVSLDLIYLLLASFFSSKRCWYQPEHN